MIRRRIALALVASWLSIVALSAQIPWHPNGCSTCRVYAWVDAPRDYVITVPGFGELSSTLPIVAGAWVIAGWGFECMSGRAIDRVDVAYSGDDGLFHPAPWYLMRLDVGVPRPDQGTGVRVREPPCD